MYYMKKSITYLLIICGFCLSTAQNTVENDTIFLSEVVVTQFQKEKLNKMATKGRKNYSIGSYYNTFFANEIKVDKCFIIKKIVFFIEKIEKNYDTKATFELAFFSVGENGLPDKKLHSQTLLFESVRKNKLEINIEDLSPKFCENFFVALKKTEDTNKKSTNYRILGHMNKRKEIYLNPENKGWHKLEGGNLAIEIYYIEEK
ncbi:hypothetical protein CGC49_06480 [Capnocytophaga sp. H4358]|nr:hypothetical protein CGC49_06480 [Capnocytophaga sp. H4358]GIM61702.1 hypothetical protein CAPN008_17520 [Capnocytophaga canis]